MDNNYDINFLDYEKVLQKSCENPTTLGVR